MTPTAATYTEAIKLSDPVTIDEAIRRLTEDDNPKIYEYRRRAKIAMDLHVHVDVRYPFVGFEYCDTKGYSQIGTADFYRYTFKSGRRPTVFQSDRFGYFHVPVSSNNGKEQ